MSDRALTYHLGPQCYRATPASANQIYCPNDGIPLLTECPNCTLPIVSPCTRYCTACGRDFGLARSGLEKPP